MKEILDVLVMVLCVILLTTLTALMVRSMRFNVMVQDGEMQWMTDDRVVSEAADDDQPDVVRQQAAIDVW